MSDIETLHDEATRDRGEPILIETLCGRVWRFGHMDIRPRKLKEYTELAQRMSTMDKAALSDGDAIRLGAIAEEMLRSALPASDRVLFDDADLDGTDILNLISKYFAKLGVDPGESAASPASSASTRKQSRPTSKRTTKRT